MAPLKHCQAPICVVPCDRVKHDSASLLCRCRERVEGRRCQIADHGGANGAGDDARGADLGGLVDGRSSDQRLIGGLELGTERRARKRHALAGPAEIEPRPTVAVYELVNVSQPNSRHPLGFQSSVPFVCARHFRSRLSRLTQLMTDHHDLPSSWIDLDTGLEISGPSKRLHSLGLPVHIREETWQGGLGSVLALILNTQPVPTMFFALGERGKPAERVADEAVAQVMHFQEAETLAMDEHSADQILLPLATAEGPSQFPVSTITSHLLTNAAVIRQFVEREIQIDGSEGEPGFVRIG